MESQLIGLPTPTGGCLSAKAHWLRWACFGLMSLVGAWTPNARAAVYNLYVPGSGTVGSDGWRGGTAEPLSGWSTGSESGVVWHSIFSGTEPNTDGRGSSYPNVNFIGDASNPGGYYSFTPGYALFRMRVAQTSFDASTYNGSDSGSFYILIDRLDLNGTGKPDYGFAWDAMNFTTPEKHGLEMTRYLSGTKWNDLKMDDTDGTQSSKLAQDINGLNGSGRPTEGYIRSVTGAGGTGAFIDVAVSWSYLIGADSGIADADRLKPGQTWKIAFATTPQANDANGLSNNSDVMGVDGGTANTLDFSGAWSASVVSAVPEVPAHPALVLPLLGLAALWRARRKGPKACA